MKRKMKVLITLFMALTISFSNLSGALVTSVHAEDSIVTDTELKAWKDTVDTFVNYMRFVNWDTSYQEGGEISRHFFENTASVYDVAYVTYFNGGYYDKYYVEASREIRVPYDVFVNDAKKYYKNIPDLTQISQEKSELYYDEEAHEFVHPDGGKGSAPLVSEVVKVDELGNKSYAIRFKVSLEEIVDNPDMNDPTQYVTCTLVVEENEEGQWRYVSFLDGYPELETDVPEEPTPYSPTLTLVSSTWTGEKDIVLHTQAQDGTVELQEMYLYIDGVSIGGTRVLPKIELDSEGNGSITFYADSLKNAKMYGPNGEEEIDWTKIDKIEIDIGFQLGKEYVSKIVYVPVDVKISNPVDNTVIVDDSGVTMELPENAPDHLTLKVNVSDGTDEKSVVEKVVKIDGDKIKTYDLSLLLDGKNYEYNGQFVSTVSLPIPTDWDINKLALYYFNEDTKEVTPVTFNVDKENGMIIFNTNHFSKYILVQKDMSTQDTSTQDIPSKENTQATDSPKTDDSTNIGLYASMFTLSGLLVIVLAVMEKKKMINNG